MAKKKRKIETYTVTCDEYLVEREDGEMFAPHEGETITFKVGYPWEAIKIRDGMTNRDFYLLLHRLQLRQIVSWTWTDEDGVPYPQPKETGYDAALWGLPDNDGAFILQCIQLQAALPNPPAEAV